MGSKYKILFSRPQPQNSNFFASQGRPPCSMLVEFVGFMRVIGLQKLLTFGAIRLVNEEFIGKTAIGHSLPPKKIRSPIASKLLVGLKKIKRVQNGTDVLYLRAKVGGDMPLHGGVRKKSWEFLFSCLFVTLHSGS